MVRPCGYKHCKTYVDPGHVLPMQLSGPKSPESPESPVDRSSFTAATVVEMFLEDIERTADDCLSQSAEWCSRISAW
jgi:hypothetical protein